MLRTVLSDGRGNSFTQSLLAEQVCLLIAIISYCYYWLLNIVNVLVNIYM